MIAILQNYCRQINSMHTTILTLALLLRAAAPNSISCANKAVTASNNCSQCLPSLVTQQSEILVQPLNQLPIDPTINVNYSYFCSVQNKSCKLTFCICVFRPSACCIQKERPPGQIPSFSEALELLPTEKGSISLHSHQISLHDKKQGVYCSEGQAAGSGKQKFTIQAVAVCQGEERSQKNNQRQIQRSLFGNVITISAKSILFIILSLSINFTRKRYRFQALARTRQPPHSAPSHPRYPRRFQLPERRKGGRADSIEVFMPATRYGEKGCFFIAESLSSCWEEVGSGGGWCTICLGHLEKQEEVRTTPCRHQYHRECIDSWCESSLSCPICRASLDFRQEIKKIYLLFPKEQILR